MLRERINVALDAIGLNGIEIGDEIVFNYTDQEMNLNELLLKKHSKEKRERIIEKIKEHQTEQKMEEVDINFGDLTTLMDLELELKHKYSLEERKAMNLVQLDNYCVFIASRYLESLEDHINLVKISKRMRGNMEKFHYNGISLNEKSISALKHIIILINAITLVAINVKHNLKVNFKNSTSTVLKHQKGYYDNFRRSAPNSNRNPCWSTR